MDDKCEPVWLGFHHGGQTAWAYAGVFALRITILLAMSFLPYANRGHSCRAKMHSGAQAPEFRTFLAIQNSGIFCQTLNSELEYYLPMQTLGLSDSTPRTESRWRALFWPTIRNVGDFDYVTRQGLWICYIVAAATTVLSAFSGFPLAGAFEGVFYFMAGLGVRQRNRFAGIAAFVGYLLSGFVLQRYAGNGFSVVRIIFLALLFTNVRGNWLAARWASEEQLEFPPMRLNQTLADKLADQLPIWLWPKVRVAFYVIAVLEIAFLFLALFAPLP